MSPVCTPATLVERRIEPPERELAPVVLRFPMPDEDQAHQLTNRPRLRHASRAGDAPARISRVR
jgi:hypothetical protein